MTAFSETAMMIGGEPGLVSVITVPEARRAIGNDVAVIILGAGLVHRVGPHRLTVRIARQCAARGLIVARFDHRGVGDSSAGSDSRPFVESAQEETLEVMNYLQAIHHVRSFVLVGLCSGAVTSLNTARSDARVVGAAMINGGLQGADLQFDMYMQDRQLAKHYWKRSLFQFDSWRRALTGQVQYRRMIGVLGRQIRDRLKPAEQTVEVSRQAQQQLRDLIERDVRLLWVECEGDWSQDYLDVLLGESGKELKQSGALRAASIPYADHVFTTRDSQERLLGLLEDWMNDLPTHAAACTEPDGTRAEQRSWA